MSETDLEFETLEKMIAKVVEENKVLRSVICMLFREMMETGNDD